jgi:hypothetical protein
MDTESPGTVFVSASMSILNGLFTQSLFLIVMSLSARLFIYTDKRLSR